MLYKDFKGLAISSLGLGCMRFPVNEDGMIDYKKASDIVDYAYNHGINYFDTAYPYHNGESEVFIGKALSKYPRDSYYLASKMPIWEVKAEADFERIFNEQLKKCDKDYFDFYLCHALNKDRHEIYKNLNGYKFLQQKKAEGKIRFLGFSFHDDSAALVKIVSEMDWDFGQIQFNYLDYELLNAKKLLEILTENKIPCIVMEPVRGGLLANTPSEVEQLFKKKEPQMSVASWAIRYVVSQENIFVTLSGMSTLEQVIDNVKTVTDFKYLSEEDLKIIDEARAIILGKNYVPCTSCKYCIECPKKVSIPEIFEAFNLYQVEKNKERFVKKYQNIISNADLCVKCGICLQYCPQKINIPQKLAEIKEFVEIN